MSKPLLPVAVLVALVASIAGFVSAGDAATKTIRVTITDTKIALSTKSAPVGRVTYFVRNTGKRTHNFRIGGKTSKTLLRGKSTTLVVVFKTAKSYAYLSTLPYGQTKGLHGVFKATRAVASVPGNAKAGAAIFAAQGCRNCHTLKAAAASGAIGPNLDKAKPSYALTIARVTNGKGVMPGFKSTLTVSQIENVAAFVYGATHP
jgi:cytochrome c553